MYLDPSLLSLKNKNFDFSFKFVRKMNGTKPLYVDILKPNQALFHTQLWFHKLMLCLT